MLYKLLLSGIAAGIFLGWLSPNLQAQTQAESSEHVIVLQQGEKQRTIESGDYLTIRTHDRRRPYYGTLQSFNDSTLTLRKHTVSVDRIRKIRSVRGRARKWAIGLMLVGLALPFLMGRFIAPIFVVRSPNGTVISGLNRVRFWNITSLLQMAAAFAGFFLSIFTVRRYRMDRWKIKRRNRAM